MSSPGPSTSSVPRKKAKIEPAFKEEWLEDQNYASWLVRHEKDPKRALCSYCKVTMKADESSLKRHKKCRKHCKEVRARMSPEEFAKYQQEEAEKNLLEYVVKNLDEDATHCFFHLMPTILPDSQIARDMLEKYDRNELFPVKNKK